MKNTIFIHYGHKEFKKELFKPIKNRNSIYVKPEGGFWGSPIKSKYGWKDWLEEECLDCDKNNSLIFKLKKDANILVINDKLKLDNLPKQKIDSSSIRLTFNRTFLDFEELSKIYDAIFLTTGHYDGRSNFYGWDCETILVMNPDCIIIEKEFLSLKQ